jgi:hypothetical protein
MGCPETKANAAGYGFAFVYTHLPAFVSTIKVKKQTCPRTDLT